MHEALQTPPLTPDDPVIEVLHNTEVVDPYRWLEDQQSERTRRWIDQQTRYMRSYLDTLPSRNLIRTRIEELLTIDTCELPHKVGNRYFFRKRHAQQEQPSIYLREGADGEDQLLVDPTTRGTGPYTSVSIFQISQDGKLLVYQIKEGGERSGSFEILNVDKREILADSLPRGFLHGLAFAPDNKSFCYVHEELGAERWHPKAAYRHVFGTPLAEDEEFFVAGDDSRLRLALSADNKHLCVAVTRLGEKIIDNYLYDFVSGAPDLIAPAISCTFGLAPAEGRIFTMSDLNAPNLCILELLIQNKRDVCWREIVPESSRRIRSFVIRNGHLIVHYTQQTAACVILFDLEGRKVREVSLPVDGTVSCNLLGSDSREISYSYESFKRPPASFRYLTRSGECLPWARMNLPFDTTDIDSVHTWYSSKDGTQIPLYLVGRNDVLKSSQIRPTILTGYGGFGMSMTPKFGILTSFMMERGCVFALANLRGGSEFGEQWHLAGQGRNRQKCFDDFLCAAEWLIQKRYTSPEKLGIFGGSNSGLLMGAALTQRPDLFRVVLCIGPLTDMLRYHLFDFARKYKPEYGIAEDPEDFRALYDYSPYHHVRSGTCYPAVLIVSGDADMNCNPMHARKMTARLQAATGSKHPVLLDYKAFRGHKPVLPLSERITGLADRLAFLCDQLGVSI